MGITIEALNPKNVKDVNRCNGEFIIDSRLVLQAENGEIRYSIINIPTTKKQYGIDSVDYTTYINSPDRIVYLAYIEGQIAGQIILRRNWNNYAYIEDIVVDTRLRRQGVGKELISIARQWGGEHNLAGIMLETQDNNVGACKFYESCGFRLKGFDTYLYKGLNHDTEEIALFWYLIFSEAASYQD